MEFYDHIIRLFFFIEHTWRLFLTMKTPRPVRTRLRLILQINQNAVIIHIVHYDARPLVSLMKHIPL